MASPVNPPLIVEIDELVKEAQGALALLLPETAAIVLLMWDMIITFDQEVELIWKAPRSIIKYLFLFIRYVALVTIIIQAAATLGIFTSAANICLISVRWVNIASSILLWAVDLLLLYRVYAFYGKNTKLLYALLGLWLLNITAVLVFAILISRDYPVIHVRTGTLPGVLPECLVPSFPRFLSEIWFIKFQVTSWKNSQGLSGVYLVFIRDGVWAYVILFVTFFGSAAENTLGGLPWVLWDVPLVAVTATRLILNLKDVGSPNKSLTWSTAPETHSTLPRWVQRVPITFDTVYESTSTEEDENFTPENE